ncbi:MAG: hypothetical protein Q7S32_03490 [bacterium]|nr:hypothetical protein [bacterium]
MASPGLNTKQFVDIHDIKEDVIILKNGSLRMIVEVGSINFDLKSSDEQIAIVDGFKNFLNSLDFPLQIVIHSRKLNIEDYLSRTSQTVENIGNELLRIQGVEYVKFVRGLVELSNVMSKRFYVVIPFYILETTESKKSVWESIKLTFGSSKNKVALLQDKEFEIYKAQIQQRAELIFDGLQGMGIGARFLTTEELVNMFSKLYNPDLV